MIFAQFTTIFARKRNFRPPKVRLFEDPSINQFVMQKSLFVTMTNHIFAGCNFLQPAFTPPGPQAAGVEILVHYVIPMQAHINGSGRVRRVMGTRSEAEGKPDPLGRAQ